VRFPFQNVGHLVVLPVGHMVFGIDPVGRRVLWEKDLTGTGGGQLPNLLPGSYAVSPRDGSLRVTYADGWVQRLGAPLALAPAVLCLQTRTGLVGFDPLTGQTLWAREDVTGNNDVFADDQAAFVVTLGPGERPQATRAFRLADGGAVRVPDFAGLYGRRLRTLGRHLLLSDTDGSERVRLRLYDVRAGKDVWERAYPPKSFVLESASPELAGAVTPDGTVQVVGAGSGKELLKAQMKPEHLVKVDTVRLLADRDSVYLACVGPTSPDIAPFGGVRPNLMPGTGLRAVPVNGEVYAFARSTGKPRWWAEMPNQMLVLDHFEDLPVLLFTAAYQKWVVDGKSRQVQQVAAAQAIDKRTGKPLYRNESLPHGNQFHTLKVDAAKGRVDLAAYQLKVTFTAEGK
jgi:outer membrane protein assembly factor BamB